MIYLYDLIMPIYNSKIKQNVWDIFSSHNGKLIICYFLLNAIFISPTPDIFKGWKPTRKLFFVFEMLENIGIVLRGVLFGVLL